MRKITGNSTSGPVDNDTQRYRKLIVFHSSPNLVGVVDELLKRDALDLEYENVIDEDLLDETIRTSITEAARDMVEHD